MNFKNACLLSNSIQKNNIENKNIEINKKEYEDLNSDEEFLEDCNDDDNEDLNYSFLEYNIKKNKNDLVNETFLDYNLNTIIDIYDKLKENNENLGFLNKSTSNKFINCIMKNIIIK